MAYKSYKVNVLSKLKNCKHELCVAIGVLGVAEVVPITPINKIKNAPTRGNLKKSIKSEVMTNDAGVYVGVTDAAPYGINVEKGIGQTAQPYLEKGMMNAIPKINKAAEEVYALKMRGL